MAGLRRDHQNAWPGVRHVLGEAQQPAEGSGINRACCMGRLLGRGRVSWPEGRALEL
jgi:hypothetical protein